MINAREIEMLSRELALQVTQVFEEIDQQIADFQQATGLSCPPHCGQCCENPTIEVTVLDCLPLAIALWQRGEAQLWLERLEHLTDSLCIFYAPDSLIPGNGRCQIYPWRPSLCRLFGFAAVRDKQMQPVLAACFRHKQLIPEKIDQIQMAIATGQSVPIFHEFLLQLAGIEPSLGTDCLPLNQALKQALQRVGLSWQLESSTNASEKEEKVDFGLLT